MIRPHTPLANADPAACLASPETAAACLAAVNDDLEQLETEFGQYLEQESLKSDVQCLRNWIASHQAGDHEAADYLREHGPSLIANIKEKLKIAAREMQRIDEESPIGGNFSGGKADRLNNAAAAAVHAESELGKALTGGTAPEESKIIAK